MLSMLLSIVLYWPVTLSANNISVRRVQKGPVLYFQKSRTEIFKHGRVHKVELGQFLPLGPGACDGYSFRLKLVSTQGTCFICTGTDVLQAMEVAKMILNPKVESVTCRIRPGSAPSYSFAELKTLAIAFKL